MSRQLFEDDLVRNPAGTSRPGRIQEISHDRAKLEHSSGTQTANHDLSDLQLLDRPWWYDDRVSDIHGRVGRVLNRGTLWQLAKRSPDGSVEYATPRPQECRHTPDRFVLPHFNSVIMYKGYIGRCEEIKADYSAAIVDSWRAIDVGRSETLPPVRIPIEAFQNRQATLYPFWMVPASLDMSDLQHVSRFSFPIRIGMQMLYKGHSWTVIDHRSSAQVEWEDGPSTWIRSNLLEPADHGEPRVGARLMHVVIANRGGPGHIVRIITGTHQTLYVVWCPYAGITVCRREDFRRFIYNDGECAGQDGCLDFDLQHHDNNESSELPDLSSLVISSGTRMEEVVHDRQAAFDFGPLYLGSFSQEDGYGRFGEYDFDNFDFDAFLAFRR